VLLTQGDQSPPFFAAVIARLSQAMDDAQVQTLPGAGHVPHLTHPTEWLAVVNEFALSKA
jgi:pimeloyl-ACP methyl ester carboxylesterase